MVRGHLFKQSFLDDLKNTHDWGDYQEDLINGLFQFINKLFAKNESYLSQLNEENNKKNIIEPILKKLGFFFSMEQSAKKGISPLFAPPVFDRISSSAVDSLFLFQPDEDQQKKEENKQGPVDYVLFDSLNSLRDFEQKKNWMLPIGILEAKKPSIELDFSQISKYLENAYKSSKGKIKWGILTNGNIWRLYCASSSEYFEIHLGDIFLNSSKTEEEKKQEFKQFYLFFRKDAFILTKEHCHVPFLDYAYSEGREWEAQVSKQLKNSIFSKVIPALAEGFYLYAESKNKTISVDKLYNNILILLYRLLFILYAESRDLLPVNYEPYKRYSFYQIREEILNNSCVSKSAHSLWERIRDLFNLIDKGDVELKLPPYNGGLFDNQKHPFFENFSIADFYLSTALDELIRDYSKNPPKIINYKDLSVAHLGSIYESLLELKLKLDETNKTFYLENDKRERKITGSYYTPDHIVEYMVRISLNSAINRIQKDFEKQRDSLLKIDSVEKLRQKAKQLSIELTDEEANNESILKNKILATKDPAMAVLNLKIIDPGMGSGHFLVKTVDYLSEQVMDFLQKTKNVSFFGLGQIYNSPLQKEIEKTKNEILKQSDAFNIDESKLKEENIIKRMILKRCIYGIDKNPLAVELAKVSLWLHTFTVGAPLSFLDHHLKHGDSLLGVSPSEIPTLIKEKEPIFYSSYWRGIVDISHLIKEIEKNTDVTLDKAKKSDEIYQSLLPIVDSLKQQYDVYLLKKIENKEKNPMQIIDKIFIKGELQNIPEELSNCIHWELEFPEVWTEKDPPGFDVVIGNPPYVRQERIKKLKPLLEKTGYKVYNATSDLYTYFYERAWQICKEKGSVCFITSNKWLRAKYGEKLRAFLKHNTEILNIIDFSGHPVFEQTVDTNIILLRKTNPNKNHNLKFAVIANKLDGDIVTHIRQVQNTMSQQSLSDNAWTLANDNILKLKGKIERIGRPLKDWDVKIYRGVLTGCNEAFIINTETRDRILADCKTEEERERTEEIIKPILRGRDIGRYCYKWAGLWIIKIKSGWTNANRGRTKPEEFFKRTAPAIYNHLLQFAKNKGKGKGLLNRDDQGDYWWELRDCSYYPEFEKEKIVWQEIVREPSFAYDSNKFYCEATSFLMTGKDLKYLIAILNSNPAAFFFRNFYAGGGLGKEGYRYKKAFLEQLPIPPITPQNQHIVKQIETLVDQILSLTKTEDYLENPQKQEKVKEYELQIDQLVYKLYDLTAEEIKSTEETNKA